MELVKIKLIYTETLKCYGISLPDFDEDLLGLPIIRGFLVSGKPITEANLANSFYYALVARYADLQGIVYPRDRRRIWWPYGTHRPNHRE